MNRRDCGIAGLSGNFSRDRGIAGSRDRRTLLGTLKRMIATDPLKECFDAVIINSVILLHKLSKLRVVKL